MRDRGERHWHDVKISKQLAPEMNILIKKFSWEITCLLRYTTKAHPAFYK